MKDDVDEIISGKEKADGGHGLYHSSVQCTADKLLCDTFQYECVI